jgi:hypothetical protein
MMFLDCPAYLDDEQTVRCGLPAEVRCRFTMRSADGLLESAMIRCPAGHWFNGPVESLTWDCKNKYGPGTAAGTSTASHSGLPRTRNGRHSEDGIAPHRFPVDIPAGPEPKVSGPCTAPAYYLGRPAWLWISVMRTRRSRPAEAGQPTHDVTRGREGMPPPGCARSPAPAPEPHS